MKTRLLALLCLIIAPLGFSQTTPSNVGQELKLIDDILGKQDQSLQRTRAERTQLIEAKVAAEAARDETAQQLQAAMQTQANLVKDATAAAEVHAQTITELAQVRAQLLAGQGSISQDEAKALRAQIVALIGETQTLQASLTSKQTEYVTMVAKFQEENKQFLVAFAAIRARLEKQSSNP